MRRYVYYPRRVGDVLLVTLTTTGERDAPTLEAVTEDKPSATQDFAKSLSFCDIPATTKRTTTTNNSTTTHNALLPASTLEVQTKLRMKSWAQNIKKTERFFSQHLLRKQPEALVRTWHPQPCDGAQHFCQDS